MLDITVTIVLQFVEGFGDVPVIHMLVKLGIDGHMMSIITPLLVGGLSH